MIVKNTVHEESQAVPLVAILSTRETRLSTGVQLSNRQSVIGGNTWPPIVQPSLMPMMSPTSIESVTSAGHTAPSLVKKSKTTWHNGSNVGAVVSCTVMICTQVLVLSQPSSAVHVRVIVISCGHSPGVMISADVMTMAVGAWQSSMAVARPVFAGSVDVSQSMVMSAGQVMTGATSSCTIISQ